MFVVRSRPPRDEPYRADGLVHPPDDRAFDPSQVCVLFVDERDKTTVAIDDPTVEGECDACLVR